MIATTLRQSPLFRDLSDSEIQSLIETMNGQMLAVSKHQTIYRPSDPARGIFIVLTGSVLAFHDDLWGESAHRRRLPSRSDLWPSLCYTTRRNDEPDGYRQRGEHHFVPGCAANPVQSRVVAPLPGAVAESDAHPRRKAC